jgi:hypothetical protein
MYVGPRIKYLMTGKRSNNNSSFKKGGMTDCSKYRGTRLLIFAHKMYAKIITGCLSAITGIVLQEERQGFRRTDRMQIVVFQQYS